MSYEGSVTTTATPATARRHNYKIPIHKRYNKSAQTKFEALERRVSDDKAAAEAEQLLHLAEALCKVLHSKLIKGRAPSPRDLELLKRLEGMCFCRDHPPLTPAARRSPLAAAELMLHRIKRTTSEEELSAHPYVDHDAIAIARIMRYVK